ncbi:MAG: hypothetical protein M0036_25265 [Desulfobacteraceae bacterium]|nr:hypothetical protein [Desulfobacteraceae bacterium]
MANRRAKSIFLFQWLAAILLVACAGSEPMTPQETVSIAVWDLEDLSPVAHGQAGMEAMLAGQIAARFGENPAYQVVERQHLLKAMEELHLGSSDLADPQACLKLGHLIGARQMIFGAYQVIGSTLRIDLRRVDVASGKVVKTASGTAGVKDLSQWLAVADKAAGELLR